MEHRWVKLTDARASSGEETIWINLDLATRMRPSTGGNTQIAIRVSDTTNSVEVKETPVEILRQLYEDRPARRRGQHA
jgi:hypothetical protein